MQACSETGAYQQQDFFRLTSQLPTPLMLYGDIVHIEESGKRRHAACRAALGVVVRASNNGCRRGVRTLQVLSFRLYMIQFPNPPPPPWLTAGRRSVEPFVPVGGRRWDPLDWVRRHLGRRISRGEQVRDGGPGRRLLGRRTKCDRPSAFLRGGDCRCGAGPCR